MKRFPFSVLVGLTIAILPAAFADEEMSPVPMVTPSESQEYFFKMLPPQCAEQGDRLVEVTKPSGVAYQVGLGGEMKELWRTEGWYAFKVFLADDGRHLVRMGPWSLGQTPESDHLAVAFYEDGKLLRSYSTAELVKDKKRVRVSASHYRWLADADDTGWFRFDPNREPHLENYHREFRLRTLEGFLYRFSLESGAIIEEVAPEKPTEWASDDEIRRLGLTLRLVQIPIELSELDAVVGLPRTVRTHFGSQGYGHEDSVEFATLAVSPPDDPKGYYAIDLRIGNYKDAKDGVPASGTIRSMQLVFISSTGYKFVPEISRQLQKYLERAESSIKEGKVTPKDAAKRFLETLNVPFGQIAR